MIFCKRPWGWWAVLFKYGNKKLKILYVKEGKSLSVQKHYHRTEEWFCVFGSGMFSKGDDPTRMRPRLFVRGHAAFVGKEQWHTFRAFEPTLIFEIQTGDCRESDIVRV